MRGLLREFGLMAPTGADRFLRELPAWLEGRKESLPERVRRRGLALWQEVRDLEERIEDLEAELEQVARDEPTIQTLQQIPGIGVLTATAFFAAVGNVHPFKSGRHLASWLGLTPKESSSGGKRRLGRISKPGDPSLRRLLIQGARSALITAGQRERAEKPLSRLPQWAVKKAREQHFNSAVVALANKMARILWAVWHHERRFDGNDRPPVLPRAA